MAHKKTVLGVTVLLAVLAAVLSICVGAVTVPPGDLLAALTGQSTGTGTAIVLYVRLPRTVGCLVSGAAPALMPMTLGEASGLASTV